jgi:hypothetical protein
MQADNPQAGQPVIARSAMAKTGPYLLLVASLVVLLLFILLGQYAHPSSDDFCMASGVNQFGLAEQLWKHYFEWSGRYSGNALYAVYPIAFGLFDGYKFIPAIVIAALILAMAFLLSTLFATRLFARPVVLASLCFVCVYLLGMLSPASGLFWLAGAFTYQTANVLVPVVLGLMIRLADRQKRDQAVAPVLVMALAAIVVAMGANETSMLALTAVALLGVLLHLRSGRARLWPWVAILLVTLACFALVYLSPGNEIRAADFSLRHDLSRSVAGSLSGGFKILWIWVSNPVFIVATLLAPFAASRLLQLSGRRFTVTVPMIAALLVSTVVLPFLLQFPAWWSMGGWPPPRTVDAIYFLFLIGWFVTVGAVTVHYRVRESSTAEQPGRGSAAAVTILSLVFAFAVVQHEALKQAKADLLQNAPRYDDYLNARYQTIEQALSDNRRYLVVADYEQAYPRTVYFNDIMRNPGHWRNVCYADYFGLDKIRRGGTGRRPALTPAGPGSRPQ